MTTIEQYLRGLFAYEFTDANMTSVLIKRDINAGEDQKNVSTENKELAQADLYMVLFNTFGLPSESVTKGNWTRNKGAVYVGVNDRKTFLEAANLIYKKYGQIDVEYGITDGTNLW
jgi:hypothetical protein